MDFPDERFKDMYDRELEIREAIDAGERALDSLRDAKQSLKSARGWGVFDLLGDDAIYRVENLLGRLRTYRR